MMRKLIINADDLGYSNNVDAKIVECIEKGLISSSTLMANAPAFEDGVRIAKLYPQISVGAHLNIIEFAPLTNIDIFQKYGVVGPDGNFIEKAIFNKPINLELKQAIFDEWDAQLTKIEVSGISPSHVDSHQHTHTIWPLNDVLCDVMKKHGISKVRRCVIPSIRIMLLEACHRTTTHVIPVSAVNTQTRKKNVLYRRVHVFVAKYKSKKWNNQMERHYSTTSRFHSFRYFYSNRSLISLGGRNAVIELMCHPGQKGFEAETSLLMRKDCWFTNDYTIINYKQLK